MVSFPIVVALSDAGSSRSSMVAYLTSWTTLGFQRIMIWELPLLGIEYAMIRLLVSIPLPFIAALVSLRLPLTDREKHKLDAAKTAAGREPGPERNAGEKPCSWACSFPAYWP